MDWGSEINSSSTPEAFVLCLLFQKKLCHWFTGEAVGNRHVLVFLTIAEILEPVMDWGMMAKSWLETNGTQKKRYTKKIK